MPMRTPNERPHIGEGVWYLGQSRRKTLPSGFCSAGRSLFPRPRSNVMILGSAEVPDDFVALTLDSIDLNADR
jgi:hypothetical protein